ncbi:MAG: C45 family autoproteolytic acyltransferase/hydrolase, partial [Prolixibacteraceae bacterium]|nr:C45 family autoproteolytic acyltransferase/hydrolase [Prolixibacteraceae bacterium]
SATPISLLAREILQYAATIDEAFEIAKKRETFVSESLLIGSGREGKAVVIEKTPEKTALFATETEQVISTNHYQSEMLRDDKDNILNINTSDSQYRFDRLTELIEAEKPLNHINAASILRNRLGTNNKDIGLGNEKSINQSICHHSVIFKPKQLLMWVSTSPWQSGTYMCYDFDKIFNSPDFSGEICSEELSIAPDEDFLRNDLPDLVVFRNMTKELRKEIKNKTQVDSVFIASYLQSNPNHYLAYQLLGTCFLENKDYNRARQYLVEALTKEIPRKPEVEQVDKQLRKINHGRNKP